MSKLRRNNVCSSPRNRSKVAERCSGEKIKFNKSKQLLSHDEFLNRIQRSLYYGNGNGNQISIPLSDYIADTFSETHRGYSLNRLNYATIGNLRSTPCSLILAMIYLDRLKDADPAYTKHVTPTELFLVSMMVATKFYSGHDDEAPYVNWSECANMTPDNLLQMELVFLTALDWKVFVSNQEFYEKVQYLETLLARRQGMNRGWFTYVELNSLLPSIQIAKHFLQTTLILGLSYTAFVATMVASVFLVSQIPGTYLNVSSRTTIHLNDITSMNSSSTQSIDSNDSLILHSSSTSIRVSETKTLNLLDLIVDRLNSTSESNEQASSKIQWNLMPIISWFKNNALQWRVINNNDNRHELFTNGFRTSLATDLFCNSTLPSGVFSVQSNIGKIRLDFNGFKSTFA